MAIDISRALKITGWMSEVELKWIAEQAKGTDTIIEIGCYQGRSTRAMVDNSDAMITCVDPWKGTYYSGAGEPLFDCDVYDKFIANLRDKRGNIKVFRYPISDELFFSQPADFIFIDGDHRYFAVRSDIISSKIFINKNGVIAGHDYGDPAWPGVKQAVDEIFPSANLVEDTTIWWVQL